MNKYRVLLDMMKDKILFMLDRYNHNDNETSTAKNLAILSNPKSKPSILQTILKKESPPQPTYNDDLNSIIDLDISSELINKKRLILIPRNVK